MKKVLVTAAAVALLAAGAAYAVSPALLSVGVKDGHPTATWSLPSGVQARLIEVATSPQVGSDGSFYREYVEDSDTLEDTQTYWESSYMLEPGTYYVHVAGIDWPCYLDDACPIREYSNVMTLTVPNAVPAISVVNFSVTGKYFAWAQARLRVCHKDRQNASLRAAQARVHNGRVAATAVRTQTAYFSGDCDLESMSWSVPSKLIRKGDTFRVTFSARDPQGATSGSVTRQVRWR